MAENNKYRQNLKSRNSMAALYMALDGQIDEEFLPELQSLEDRVKAYKEMSRNDSTIVAVLRAIRSLVSQVSWKVVAASDKPNDIKAKQLVETSLLDMRTSFANVVTNRIFSNLVYGFSILEPVYKKRQGRHPKSGAKSQYNDGMIGWEDLYFVAQDSIAGWVYDEKYNIIGVKQKHPNTGNEITLPIEEICIFTPESEKDNPEGPSILRGAFLDYYCKKRTKEMFLVGAEKDVVNMMVISAPSQSMSSPRNSAMNDYFKKVIQGYRVNKHFGMYKPKEVDVELLKSGGMKTFDLLEYIRYFDKQMAQTMLADFVLLGGQGSTGSYSLSSDKTKIFSTLVGAMLVNTESGFNNQLIPDLVDINAIDVTQYPRIEAGDIEKLDMTSVMLFLQSANAHKLPIYTLDVVNAIFDQLELPKFKSQEEFEEAMRETARHLANKPEALTPPNEENKKE